MRVVVLDLEGGNDMVGIMHRADVEITDFPLLKNHPVIITDDGETYLGIECWWTPYDDYVTANESIALCGGYIK